MRVRLQRAVCSDDRAVLGLSPSQDRAWEAGSGLSSEAPQWARTGLVRTPPAHLPPAAGGRHPRAPRAASSAPGKAVKASPWEFCLKLPRPRPPKASLPGPLLSPHPQLLGVSAGPPAAQKGYSSNLGGFLMTVRPLLPLWSLVAPES